MSKVFAFLKDQSGATAIEYGLIAAGISVVIITAVQSVGSNLTNTFESIANAMKGVSNVDQLQDYAKQLAPMGQLGLKVFQSFMDGAMKAPTGDADHKPKGKSD